MRDTHAYILMRNELLDSLSYILFGEVEDLQNTIW